MSRRSNGELRCARCRLHRSLCACELIPRLTTRTRLVLFMHRFEDNKSTNTGRLASECLSNSEVILRGVQGGPAEVFEPPPGTCPVFLFPRKGAIPIREFAGSAEPVTLIVPDGTWRQASKVQNRVPGLADIPCVSLPPGERSSYRLRFEAHAEGLSTLEAIARALGVLEGLHVQHALERVFRIVIERALWSRGAIPTSEVAGGVPEGVQRHDPRSRARDE